MPRSRSYSTPGIAASPSLSGTVTFASGTILAFGSVAGTTIGQAGDKIAFLGATPVAQVTTAIAPASFVANTSLIADATATFGGYTVGQVVAALKALGLLA